MSQCHDMYGPVETTGAGTTQAHGTQAHGTHLDWAQCHDPYPTDSPPVGVSAAPRPKTGGGRERAEVVRVRGRVDWRTERAMREIIDGDSERAIIVDLSSAPPGFYGRKELTVFLARARQRGRRAVVVSRNPVVYKPLLGTGLRPIVPVVPSEPEAVRWLVRHPWRGLNA